MAGGCKSLCEMGTRSSSKRGEAGMTVMGMMAEGLACGDIGKLMQGMPS